MLDLNGVTLTARGSFVAACSVAVLVLVFSTGRAGFWEPHEIDTLSQLEGNHITNIAVSGAQEGARERQEAVKADPKSAAKPTHEVEDCDDAEPVIPLKSSLIDSSHRAFGGEWGARLPLVLASLLMCAIVWLLATLAVSPRAGLLATIVFATFPAILFGTKQITGDTIAQAAAALSVLGGALALGITSKRQLRLLGGILCVVGCVLGTLASGVLVGLVAPAGAIAVAALTAGSSEPSDGRKPWLLVVGGVAAAIALAAACYFVAHVFDWVPAQTGDLHIVGSTLEACRGKSIAAMASWHGSGDLEIGFNALVEDIGFGAFPWAAVAPFAMLSLLSPSSPRRGTISTLLFAWAALSWVLGGINERGAEPVHYTGFAAIAIATGMWLDDLISGRLPRLGYQLVGLFVALAAVVLAKDLVAFPEKMLSIALTDGEYTAPKGSWLPRATIALGIVFALFVALSLIVQSAPGRLGQLVRHGVFGATAASLLFALYLAHIAIPTISRALSSAGSFDLLSEVRDGEPLGVLGRLGAGPTYYAGDDYTLLKNKNELYDLLARDERVFALMPTADHCVLHSAQPTHEFSYFIIDDQNSKHLLLSNRLGEGDTDRNKLARTIVRERPADIGKALSINFDDQVELIGVRMPEAVDRGERFKVTLYYEVKKRVRRNWKIFLHFDGGGQRFQGDHDPGELFCATSRWRAGDFIVDEVEVDAGGLTYSKGDYQAWAGFFSGSAGNWTNMKVKTAGADAADRYPIGSLRVK